MSKAKTLEIKIIKALKDKNLSMMVMILLLIN